MSYHIFISCYMYGYRHRHRHRKLTFAKNTVSHGGFKKCTMATILSHEVTSGSDIKICRML